MNKEVDLGSLHGLVESQNQANSGDVEDAMGDYEGTDLAGGD